MGRQSTQKRLGVLDYLENWARNSSGLMLTRATRNASGFKGFFQKQHLPTHHFFVQTPEFLCRLGLLCKATECSSV